jgi:hypothetical protein
MMTTLAATAFVVLAFVLAAVVFTNEVSKMTSGLIS